jgi:hypothetical protein
MHSWENLVRHVLFRHGTRCQYLHGGFSQHVNLAGLNRRTLCAGLNITRVNGSRVVLKLLRACETQLNYSVHTCLHAIPTSLHPYSTGLAASMNEQVPDPDSVRCTHGTLSGS